MTIMQEIRVQSAILAHIMLLPPREAVMFRGAVGKPDYRLKF